MDKETWKDIKNYEKLYQISNFGNVKSLAKNLIIKNNPIQKIRRQKEKILKQFKTGIGNSKYYGVVLCNNYKRKNYKVHRLVAETFIINKDNKKNEINHKDKYHYNNNVNNLEWVTRQENINHRYNKCQEIINQANKELKKQ